MESTSSGESEHDVVYALGALVINAASLEESLHDAIFLLAGSHDFVNSLTAGLPFRMLVDKFGALCQANKQCRVSAEEVRQFCVTLNALYDERNTIIHSAYYLHGNERPHRRYKRTAKPKTGFALNVTEITAAGLRGLSERLRAASAKIWDIVP